jgi:hypothetical protein
MSQREIKYDNFNPQPLAAFVLLFERKTTLELAQALAVKSLFPAMLSLVVPPIISADIERALAQKPKVNFGHPLYCVVHQNTEVEEDVLLTVYALAEGRETTAPYNKIGFRPLRLGDRLRWQVTGPAVMTNVAGQRAEVVKVTRDINGPVTSFKNLDHTGSGDHIYALYGEIGGDDFDLLVGGA